ncbi:NF-kappa-B inhibitor-interacting Ras-like protein 2 isoform X3 [Macrotis lagotis]
MGKSCKVVVCGQASVGKTSILEQLLYGNHVVGSEMIETQEDIYVGSIETDRGVREQVRFYDTRGLRDGAELPRHCFSCTDGYVLVYSTNSRESFQRVELLKKEIDKSKDKKEVTIVVLGNKCDLQEQRRVDPDVAQHWAKVEKGVCIKDPPWWRRGLVSTLFTYYRGDSEQGTFPLWASASSPIKMKESRLSDF